MTDDHKRIFDSLDQWLAVHYGHRLFMLFKDRWVAILRCDSCDRLFVGFPRT